MQTLLRLCVLLCALALTGCATTGQGPDPWEPYNRKAHAFNDTVDKAVLKPTAEAYVNVVPGFAREGVGNFFRNLEDIGTSVNNLLQGKPAQAANDVARFGVNTILGVFGLWDVATPMGLDKHYEDFGQTLGVWGVPSGPYFVIPFLGPSTARDAPARVVDPEYAYSRYIDPDALKWTLFTLDLVDTRAGLLKAGNVLQEAALDEYSFIRDAWLQRRRNQVYDGKPPKRAEDE
jgi:phospholipid-binding lipoprotein MlaA